MCANSEFIISDKEKPLSFNPKSGKFIYYDEIVNGKEKIVPLETLSEEDLKRLVVERNRKGPDYIVYSLNGAKHTRNDVIREIEQDTDFGKKTVTAEVSYLSDLLRKIGASLKG